MAASFTSPTSRRCSSVPRNRRRQAAKHCSRSTAKASPGSVTSPTSPRWLLGGIAGPLERLWLLLKLKSRPPITREALNLIGNPNLLDNRCTRELLDWQPAVTYVAGMQAVAAYIHEQGMNKR